MLGEKVYGNTIEKWIKLYLPRIYKVSHRYLFLAKKVGLEFDDLVVFGKLGVVQALEGYDPTRGANIESRIYAKIHYNILEELRKYIRTKEKRKSNGLEKLNSGEMRQLRGRMFTHEDESSVIDKVVFNSIINEINTVLVDKDLREGLQRILRTKEHNPFCTNREVGKLLGISEARVFQLISEIRGKIRNRHEKTPIGSLVEDDRRSISPYED